MAFFASAPTAIDPGDEPEDHAAHLYLPAIVHQALTAADGEVESEAIAPPDAAPMPPLPGEAGGPPAGIYLPAVGK